MLNRVKYGHDGWIRYLDGKRQGGFGYRWVEAPANRLTHLMAETILIIGAGVAGLAAAQKFVQAGRQVLVLAVCRTYASE